MISIRKSRFPGGRYKAATFSYDDGTIYDRRLVDIFNRAGLKGSFHLNSGRMTGDLKIPPSEIADLYRGHEISAHSVTHPSLTVVPPAQMAMEILEDRRALEKLCGYPVRGMSYPNGAYSEAIARALPGFGIEYARTIQAHRQFHLPEDLHRWHPTCHHRDGLEALTAEFLEKPNNGRLSLLYVWGHSIDFERAGNWDVIERVASTLAPLADTVWFATNIEIVDYLQALRQLRTSVDGHLVHNQSHLPVWFLANQEEIMLEPGEFREIG